MKVKTFGSTGRDVTIVGLGGEGVLRTHGRLTEAKAVINAAVDEGISYFDSAHVYADSELYYGEIWKACPDKRLGVFQASKSASRDREGALADLESTLDRMQTDYLDLWQIHDVRTAQDLDMISGKGGALEAFLEAKDSGKVRFIGVTGHHDPHILTRAVQDWPVDSVMMPVNPIEGILGGFLTGTMPLAKEKGVAVIAMKILGGGHFIIPELDITPALLTRYALSKDIDVAIVGCSTPAEVKALSDHGSAFEPVSDSEEAELLKAMKPYAERMAFYRGVI